ncbi:3'-5' exonuclease [Clostridium cellulovorans]|nr:3'-5' exonuclease [Clostridium cellulovorans]
MKLNKEQQLLINEDENNILLLASAGTGKTDTLSKRIARIIESGKGKPEEILCITFTNKACREMKERIEKVIGDSSRNITIRTFHSFCFDILKVEAKKKTDIFTDFIIFDEEDCKEMIKVCAPPGFSIAPMQRFIDSVKNIRVKYDIYSDNSLEDYKNAIGIFLSHEENKINNICTEKGHLDEALKNFLINKGHILVSSYNRLLSENHGLDFTDLIVLTKELFENQQVVSALRERYKYINIDEVQDTSLLEYSIIEKLFKNNKVLICGDIFQTIYKWRGSAPEKIFEKFKKDYGVTEIVFNVNYRATKNLTDASLKFLYNTFPLETQSLYKQGITTNSIEVGEKIILKEAYDIREEAKFIYEEIKNLKNKAEDLSSICVLTRDNRYNIALSNQLRDIASYEEDGFEFILVDQFKFFRRQEIKDIIAFLKLSANRYDSISLKRIVKRLPTGVGDRTFEAIESDEYKKIGIILSDFIDTNTLQYGEKFSLLIKEFKDDNIIVFDVESTGTDVTEDEIIQIAAIRINRNGEVIDSFERFLKPKKSVKNSEHIHGFSDEFLKEKGEDKETVIKEFLRFSENAVIVGHNVQYDINILSSEIHRLNLGKSKFLAFYDTLDIYRRFYPNLVNHKLNTLSDIFKTENIPSHDAMDDILATKDLLIRALKIDIIPTSMERIAGMSKYIKAFSFISEKLNDFFKETEEMRPCEVVNYIVQHFNLKTLYPGEEGKGKIERMRDFYALLRDIDDKNKGSRDSLFDIIKLTSLSNGELESLILKRTKKSRIPIITVHQAKGLEYETVFLAGTAQNVFPSYLSIKTNNLEEEKKTFYVAITRAKKRLFISYCLYNEYNKRNFKSDFINFLPQTYIELK